MILSHRMTIEPPLTATSPQQPPLYNGHFFSLVRTMGNVMDSNLMHINDLPQPYSTLTRPQRGLISSLYHYSTHYTFSIQIHSNVLT